MSEQPLAGAIGVPAPLGRIAAGGLGRLALAGLILVLVAAVVTMSGGAGLAGRLGALFGRHSKHAAKPVPALQVAAPTAVQHAVTIASQAPARPLPDLKRPARRSPAATRPPREAPARPAPQPALPPSPAVPPPVEVPRPAPAPAGNVQRAVKAIRETAAPLAPPAQPVLDQTVAAVDQACGLLGGCP